MIVTDQMAIAAPTPLDYARLAQHAYSAPPQIGAQDSSARAIIFGDVVAFPGTNNIACWLADLDCDVVSVDGLGGLHAGFWHALESIKGPLLTMAPNTTVGHSEGGALAILYAAALCLAGKPPKEVYAFEPPMVSIDDTLENLFKSHGVAVYLYRHGEDVVPLIPRMFHDWQHPAPLIQFGKPSFPVPNVEDHLICNVIDSLVTLCANVTSA